MTVTCCPRLSVIALSSPSLALQNTTRDVRAVCSSQKCRHMYASRLQSHAVLSCPVVDVPGSWQSSPVAPRLLLEKLVIQAICKIGDGNAVPQMFDHFRCRRCGNKSAHAVGLLAGEVTVLPETCLLRLLVVLIYTLLLLFPFCSTVVSPCRPYRTAAPIGVHAVRNRCQRDATSARCVGTRFIASLRSARHWFVVVLCKCPRRVQHHVSVSLSTCGRIQRNRR